MKPSPVSDRRPKNLDEAPELLTLIQAAHAIGMSLENVRQLEANDPAFPKRLRIPFGKVAKFRRFELIAWQHRPDVEAVEAGAC